MIKGRVVDAKTDKLVQSFNVRIITTKKQNLSERFGWDLIKRGKVGLIADVHRFEK